MVSQFRLIMPKTGSSGDMVQSPISLPGPLMGSTPVATKQKKSAKATLAPANTSQQKAEEVAGGTKLHDLNTRFANVIGKNSGVVQENQRLRDEIDNIRSAHKDELDKIKQFYDNEVKEGHSLLNHAAEEKFKLEQDNFSTREKNRVLAEQYKEKCLSERVARELAEDLQKQVDVMNGEAQTLRRKHQDLDTQKMSLKAQLDKATSDADRFKQEMNDAKLEIAKKNNENQSLREKFETESKVRDVEVEQARRDQTSILQQSLQLKNSNDESMAIAIENIRDEHALELKKIEDRFQKDNRRAINKLEGKVADLNKVLTAKRDEASKNRALADQSKGEALRMEKELGSAKRRVLNLEADLASQKTLADDATMELKEQLRASDNQVKKFEDIYETEKARFISLEQECQTYRSLLEVEEARLNITPSPIRRKRTRNAVGSESMSTPATKRSRSADNTQQEIDVDDVGASDAKRDADASCFLM